MFGQIYSKEEVKEKIMAIDMELSSAVSESEIDTGVNRQKWIVKIDSLKKQRDYWLNMYQQLCFSEQTGGGVYSTCPGTGGVNL